MTASDHVPVTLAEIARIAGVGRAAVSNWRRRHDSFPTRIGGTDVSPQFSLAEVQRWLQENGKIEGTGGRELLWPRLEALGSLEETGLTIADAARRMRGARARSGAGGTSEQSRALAGEVARIGRRDGTEETFGFFLQRWLDTHVRQISTTPPPLASLMTSIARRLTDSQNGTTVIDPACGTGHLLTAAAEEFGGTGTTLAGCEREPALAALAAARLAFATDNTDTRVELTTGDALREDPYAELVADVALCNPPFNERDWGYEELATDTRWTHGLPPRTEPELAWVQHVLAHVRPGGVAVVVLPPAVSSRRAGRRIRGSLLRKGLLRAVVALPPGCAQPHGVSLHLWIFRGADETRPRADDVLLVDAIDAGRPTSREAGTPDWGAVTCLVESALASYSTTVELPAGAARVPLLTLLDDEVDVTPGRYVTSAAGTEGDASVEEWNHLEETFSSLRALVKELSAIDTNEVARSSHPTATVGDLAKAGALVLRSGQQPEDTASIIHDARDGALPLLTMPDLITDGNPGVWLLDAGDHTVAKEGDVIVAGVVRAFDAWVHKGEPTALGPQLYALRVDQQKLDPHFLAGCLRAPSNGRQAGTHASTSSRVDVRKLNVLQLPLDGQAPYGEVFQQITDFTGRLSRASTLGTGLAQALNERLATGGLGMHR
ncbi:N-6 DNA methylase [Streptomyces sp. TR06-5]|uniref:N-6 DNA methylase n=1 Tax=Streptomyces sp. TR06-5 TaxID=3385976 RepID=UPI0039A12900